MNARETAPDEIFSVANNLGEGILWDALRKALWWTDIHSSHLYRYDWAIKALERFDTPERVCSFGLIAGSDRLITAFASGIAIYDPRNPAMDRTFLSAPLAPGLRFNDGRVDRQGRFWVGTMVESKPNTAGADLYSVDRGRMRRHLGGIEISNSLCTSPDGARLYFADSPKRTIFVYDLLEPEGKLGPARVFAQTPEGAFPDGATVDADGCLWSAQWGAGRVVRYTPDQKIDRILSVPARQPSCVCFGGPDLDLLYVTSAREGLDAAALHADPNAGDVFAYRTGNRGLSESQYRS